MRAGVVFLRLLASTWRVRVVNGDVFVPLREAGAGFLLALWHGEMLPILWQHRGQPIAVLISSHRDGEIIARIVAALGVGAVRGSSSRGGARALLEIVRELESGREIAITPDGPRGPAHRVAPGVLAAAQRTGAPIIAIRATARRAWRLNSWDGFLIPKPFTTVTVAYSDPYTVTAPSTREAERETSRLEEIMARTAVGAEG